MSSDRIQTCARDEDKYDLELRFEPKHRSGIQQSKEYHIFGMHICMTSTAYGLWNGHVHDKYSFIPLGNLVSP